LRVFVALRPNQWTAARAPLAASLFAVPGPHPILNPAERGRLHSRWSTRLHFTIDTRECRVARKARDSSCTQASPTKQLERAVEPQREKHRNSPLAIAMHAILRHSTIVNADTFFVLKIVQIKLGPRLHDERRRVCANMQLSTAYLEG